MAIRDTSDKHSLTVHTGSDTWQSKVYLDGEELTNVSALTIEMSARDVPRVHLTLIVSDVQFIGTGMVVSATLPVLIPGVEG